MIINSTFLIESFSNKPSFKPVNTSIRFLLDFEDPFVLDNIVIEGSRT
jgi:hypothetical protein